MFASISSLDTVLQCLLPVFTQPSFQTHIEVLLGWVMCLGKRTEYGVFQTIQADMPVSRKQRHPFDRFYNFFSRSAWTVHDLAYQVCVAVVIGLNPPGLLYLVVDDTLLHKRGQHVYGLGWFRDAVASTAKRVATASGNHWVVMGLAICIPRTNKIYCLVIHAKLHLPGKGRPSEATLAKQMLDDVLGWFPDRMLVFLGDGAYSAKNLLGNLSPRVTHIGVMRADAAIYDPRPPKQSKSKRGTKPRKGPRLWLMQSVIGLWYLTDGRKLPQARAARQRLGEWDTEWSLRHMLRVLHSVILEQTITVNSATKADLRELLHQLKNYLHLAV